MGKQEDEFWDRQHHQQRASLALAEMLFTDGSGATRAENDLAGVLEAATARIRSDEQRLGDEIESLHRKYTDKLAATNSLNDRIAELERQLAKTEQYLAVAEGQAKGGPPGWKKNDRSNQYNDWMKRMDGGFSLHVDRWRPAGAWHWWLTGDGSEVLSSGTSPTTHGAIAAAEAAYQEAIASHGEQ